MTEVAAAPNAGYLELGSGGESVWGVIMRGCVLGGRSRSSVCAFGAAMETCHAHP